MTVMKVTNNDPAGADLTIEVQRCIGDTELIAECKVFNDTVTCYFLVNFAWDRLERLQMRVFMQLKDDDGLVKPYTLDHLSYSRYSHWYNINKENNIFSTNSNIWQLICVHISDNVEDLNLKLTPNKCVPFKKLYDDADVTDFKLFGETDDTYGVSFHRNVLALSSPVLKSMLLGDWKETRQGNVQLALVSKNTLQHFKDYIYLNNIPDLPIDCAKLICLASYYMLKRLPDLKRDVAIKLESVFSPENLWEWLELCVQHKNTLLLDMRLQHLQYGDKQTIADMDNYFLKGPYKALFELKPECAFIKYYDLYNEKDFIDFEFRAGDDNMYSSVDVHRNVMAAFSPVFKALFLNEWKDAKYGYMPNDVSKLTLQQFKDFIYLQKIPDDSSDCAKLITLAAYYKIPELESIAALKIAENLKPENFWEWLEYCIEQKHEYLLVAMMKNIYYRNKIDSVTAYLSK
ncbi:BTB/POZ domain-containing protein [Phthorimaea operculella]|nr:BTB/POZ domain-containing protein [Phthorimaea operculella]